MSTLKGLSTVWESTVLASSLSHFLTRVKTESRLLRDSIRSHPISYDLSTWSLSPCLNVKTVDAFISTLQRRSPGTSELVSISMPCQTLRPLSVCITGGQTLDGIATIPGENSIASSEYILSLQISGFATSGVTFATWHPATSSVVVRHCRLFQTVRQSAGIWEPTLRLQAMLGQLLTKGCALFVIRSLRDLQAFVLAGSQGEVKFFGEDRKSWLSSMARMRRGLSVSTEISGYGAGVEFSGPLAKNMTKQFVTASKFPNGQTSPRVWDFSGLCVTPFKKTTGLTRTFLKPKQNSHFNSL